MALTRELLDQAVQLHRSGRLAEAETLYRQVLRQQPNQPDALNLLGVIASQSDLPEMAISFTRRALAVAPGEAEFHRNLASAYKATGELANAVFEYREALRLRPDFAEAHIYLSDTLMEQGEMALALAHSLEALRLKPDSALAYCTLGELAVQGHHTFTSADLAHMTALIESGKQSTHDTSLLYFTLAACREKQGDYDEALQLYRRANHCKREVYRQANKAFEPAKHRHLIDELMTVFTPEFFARTRYAGNDSDQPIFVVGMVRSGTSLVEQILASHPQVFGAGELKDIDQISHALPRRLKVPLSYPGCLAHADPTVLRTLADLYLNRLAKLSRAAPARVVDKMPHNYLHLGLIAVLFPNAHIIHCRRDPLDVCVSAYCQNFKWLPYAASMEEIGFYHHHYERLMEHWRMVLPLPIHEVVYEDIVANQEAVTRQLLAFAGLSWNDRCLAFHQSSRSVQSASKLQVRQPIYHRSVARWQRFEAHLQPLREALANPDPPAIPPKASGDA